MLQSYRLDKRFPVPSQPMVTNSSKVKLFLIQQLVVLPIVELPS